MEKTLEILKLIGETSSRNEKEAILLKHKDNQLLKDILYFVYNPYIVTGLNKKKINKNVRLTMHGHLESIEMTMEYLKVNNTGKDIDIITIQDFLAEQEEDHKDILTQIVIKDLKIGVTAKTINKVYGKNFIPEFSVMLAEKYFECEDKVTGEFIVTQKLDGIRCVIIKENGSIKIFSRQGQEIEDLVEIVAEAERLTDDLVYDGELILVNNKNLSSKDLYRETVKVARKDGIKKNLIFNCFDIVPLEDFKKGVCYIHCDKRKTQISINLVDHIQGEPLKYIVEVPVLYKGDDKSMIIELLDEAINNQQEGVMVNIANAPYECKRSKGILKVKKFNDADVRVLHVLEGTGKNINKLGAITIQFEHNGKLHECNCGSGFSDEERIKYWEHPELLLGKIVTIGYFEVSENQQGGTGLRFPTWKSIIREDKNEISMY